MHQSRRRFTLIELLVVVAIIAILASMLLPVLSDAKRKARDLDCLNKIKQLYLTTNLYVDNYDGYVPPLAGADDYGWGYNYGSWMHPMAETAGIANFVGTSWRRYDASPYWCPEVKPKWIWAYGFPHGAYAFNWRIRYRTPLKSGETPNPRISHRLTDCVRPTEIFLLTEASWYGYADVPNRGFLDWSMRGHPTPGIAPADHTGRGMNFVWFDGHARWMPYNEVMQYPLNQIPEAKFFGTNTYRSLY